MYFLCESYDYGSFNEMLGRFVFVLSYVWIGGGFGTCSITIFLIFEKQIVDFKCDFPLLLRGWILISAATIMPNKSSLLGVDCNDLLIFSIISNSLVGFSGACLTSSLRFFTLQCLYHGVSNVSGFSKHSKISSFRSNLWNCRQSQSCHRTLG